MGKITPISAVRPQAMELFTGIGLARMGLEKAGFRVVWAKDYEPDKKAMYDAQFGESHDHNFALGDIGKVKAVDLPRDTALAWASSPCTDLAAARLAYGEGRKRPAPDAINVSELVGTFMAEFSDSTNTE